ncbi:unnamed protein product, partial [Prorocentrum cordatum]
APSSARRVPRCHLWSQEWQHGKAAFPLASAAPQRRCTAPLLPSADRVRATGTLLPAVGGHLPPVAREPPKEPRDRRRGASRAAAPLARAAEAMPRAATAEARGAQARRSSQDEFASPRQTIIILDWDDTLFPTSYVRDRQSPDRIRLARAAAAAEQLLRRAAALGEVRIVTLAKAPWVSMSCEHFFPGARGRACIQDQDRMNEAFADNLGAFRETQASDPDQTSKAAQRQSRLCKPNQLKGVRAGH